MPLLPLYIASLGASHTEIGAIMAAGSVGGLLSRPIAGLALDYWGRRQVVMTGTLVLAAALGMLGMVTTPGPLAYLSRFVFGIGEGALFTGYFAWASDMVPEERRTEGLALFGIAGLFPLTVTPLLGAVSFEPGELQALFPVLAIVVLLSLTVVIPLRNIAAPSQADGINLRRIAKALWQPRLRPVWFASALFAMLVSVYLSFSAIAAASHGVENPSLLWVTYGAGAITLRLLGARLPDRVGPRNLVVPALGMYLGAMLLVANATTTSGFITAGLIAGLGHGYCFPILASQVVTRSTASMRGSALAVYAFLWEISALVFTPVFGSISDHWGTPNMFLIAATLGIAGLAIWAIIEHRAE